MNSQLVLAALTALLMAANVPLGYLRRGHERLSYGWFFYLYLSVPVVVYLRAKTGYHWGGVPVLLFGVLVGQSLGGMLEKHRFIVYVK